MAWSEGLKTHFETEWEGDFDWSRGRKIADHLYVTSINHGDYMLVKGVDFGKGAGVIEVGVSPLYGGKIEIHSGTIDGPTVATIDIEGSREAGIWKIVSASVESVSGIHDLYFVFRGEKDLFYFDWWKFSK